jgi:hypothetical protein
VKHFPLVLAWLCLFARSAHAQKACGESPSCGECFAFHGRFAVYTGDGQETLWPVGTHRLLRPVFGTDTLYKLLGEDTRYLDEYFIFGDFVVCPLEKDTPGHIRNVCIKSARNLRRVRRHLFLRYELPQRWLPYSIATRLAVDWSPSTG